MRLFLHFRFILRQFSGVGSQTGTFLLCVALSMISLLSLLYTKRIPLRLQLRSQLKDWRTSWPIAGKK